MAQPKTQHTEDMPQEATDTTRYLCAAAYIDFTYRQEVLKTLLTDDFKAIAPIPGVHLPTLLYYALEAQQYQKAIDAWLSGLLLLFLFTRGMTFFLAPIVLAIEYYHIHFRVLPKRFSSQQFRRIDFRSLPANYPFKEHFSGLESLEDGNVLIYSNEGFYPFVGSGVDLGGWSQVVDTTKPPAEDPDKSPLPFTQEELYAQLEADLQRLGIPEMRIRDRVFVPGQSIREDRRFLPSYFERPKTSLDPVTLGEIKMANKATCRYYKQVEILTWKGEMAFSIFFRLVRLKDHLFLEVQQYLLPPLKKRFYSVDNYTSFLTFRKIRQYIRTVAVQSIIRPFIAPFNLINMVISHWTQRQLEKNARREVKENALYDYGASKNLRELASDNKYALYIQKIDKEMYGQLIQLQLMDSFVEFLKRHHVDVSRLIETSAFIMNQQNTLIGPGAHINAPVATGPHATATMETTFNKAAGAAKQALARATQTV